MAYTEFGLNDDNAIKLWSKVLAKSERESLDIAPLMGTDDNAIIQIKEETQKGPGDKVTFTLRARLQGDGFTRGQTAEGNGEALSTFTDAIYINELGHVVGSASENTIDAQRVPFNLRKECKDALSDWWTDRKSISFFNHVCGYLPASNVKFTGMNAVLPTSGSAECVRQIFPGSSTNDESLSNSDTLTMTLIDKAVAAARTSSPIVNTVRIGGQKKHVVYLHEQQVVQMRASASGSDWADVTKFTYSGVDVSKNPIYSGALGEWNNCILRRSQDVRPGVHHSNNTSVANTRRAVLLGSQAAVAAFGMKTQPSQYRWNEELLDHKRKLEVSAWSIWGLKKTVFNTVDYGTVVISAYSAV